MGLSFLVDDVVISRPCVDISKTLEVLETMGVPVCGYQTPIFPAFFTNDSGCYAPIEVDNALAVARMMACQEDLSLGE
jgi:pseudouridylate synthase